MRDAIIKFLLNFKFSFANFLAMYVVTGIFSYFFYLSSNKFPVALLKDVGDIKIAMITILTGVISYYFGSSKGSKDKSDAINDLKKDTAK